MVGLLPAPVSIYRGEGHCWSYRKGYFPSQRSKGKRTKGFAAFILLDIKNAFNSGSWAGIIKDVDDRNIDKS